MLPGWARAQFAPQPSSLANVSATIPTGVGTVDIVIRQSGASFSATLTTPIAATRVCFILALETPRSPRTAVPPCHPVYNRAPLDRLIRTRGSTANREPC